MLRLTIICPVFNEQLVIPLFFARLRPIIEILSKKYRVDLVFLNNASTDASFSELLKLREQWPFVYVLTMSRNVGYQRSLDCGLRSVVGDIFAIIDVDCEDPPELLLDFVARYEEGYQIVYGIRADRQEGALLKSIRKLFYRILKTVADDDIILDMAEFSLFTVEVRDAMVVESNSFPFIRASISRVGFNRLGIPFSRQKRIAGSTHYNFIGMSIFAVAGILSASTLLLRLPIFILPFWIGGLICLGMDYTSTGARSDLAAAAVLFATYVGATVAVIALYVARTYKNSLHRPNSYIHSAGSLPQERDHTSRVACP
jgi:dolichol-phosphate mannosyltransferase